MSFVDLVQQRRSSRHYLSQPVPREKIDRCLQAARLAPSACNSQPWRFIVVEDADLKDELSRKAFSGIYGMNRFAGQAPVLVAVVRGRSRYAACLGGALRDVQYSLIDIGIAAQHFVLQAVEEGLGTCWLGWFNEASVKKVLGLGRKDRVDILLSLGFVPEGSQSATSRKALEEISEYRS